ncbi:MAG: response regulator transcription factor [bacterium]|nr:response regulator transcription factor [Candidatus Kapabacteria bacterium]
MRILVVEDDRNIADVLRRGLVDQHYSVDVAHEGLEGAELAVVNDYDLLILDIMLPGMDGKTICRQVRSEGILTPIIMLTALGLSGDVINGLDAGADDYLTKPFDFGVLLARVRSLTRRHSEMRTSEIRIADMLMDTARRTVVRDGQAINLTAKEFALLEYFVMNSGRVLTREAIGEHVWDINFDPRSNVIESLVRFLRQKIEVEGEESIIQTVRGVGYRLDV